MSTDKRKPLQLKSKIPGLDNLKKLTDRLPPCFKDTFEGKYGKILDLLSIRVQIMAINALAQFYDPPLQSFLFQDF